MRELTNEEARTVTGGFGPWGALLGVVVSAISSYRQGKDLKSAVGSAVLAGVSGFFGGVAATVGAVSIGARVAAGVVSIFAGVKSNEFDYSGLFHLE